MRPGRIGRGRVEHPGHYSHPRYTCRSDLPDSYSRTRKLITSLAESASEISNTFQGLIADAISEQIIEALNMFFEIEIGETTTVGDLLEDWLDVKLAGTYNYQFSAYEQTSSF